MQSSFVWNVKKLPAPSNTTAASGTVQMTDLVMFSCIQIGEGMDFIFRGCMKSFLTYIHQKYNRNVIILGNAGLELFDVHSEVAETKKQRKWSLKFD